MNLDWHYVEDWAKSRLESSRQRNDGDLDAIATARLRGRIDFIKELLALPESKKAQDARSSIDAPE
jgi:hypothetical protein